MSTNNYNSNMAPSLGGYTGTGVPTSARPCNPSLGTIFYNNGNQEMWDGFTWVQISPVYPASPVFTGTQVASTQYVNNALSASTTFNSADGKKKVSVDEVITAVEFMKVMKRRMCILEPAFEKHEHFPALKEAYENYLLIERLWSGDDIDKE
jgi:hypothetical protein